MPDQEYQAIKKAAPLGEAHYSERKRGERIRYHPDADPNVIEEGEIIFVQQAGLIGTHHSPLCYSVSTDKGTRDVVWQIDVIEAPPD